jgi:hypothetical protein
MRTTLRMSEYAVHFSLDMWTSPNHRSYLAVVAHFISNGESKTALLGFRRVMGPHAGDNLAHYFWQVVENFDLTRRIGYFTLDNASNNDSMLQSIASRLANVGIDFNPVERRIRCLGHVINLVVKSFLWGENAEAVEHDLDEAAAAPQEELAELRRWRQRGPLGKLYNCIRYVLRTPQRRDRFHDKARIYTTHGEPLGLLIGNDTRWNGDLDAISRALELREPLEDFISSAIRTDKAHGEGSLEWDELSSDDWQDLRTIQEILQPFKKWSLRLQGKGSAAGLCEVLPAYDEMLAHLEESRTYHRSLPAGSSFILTSLNTAWATLDK